MLLNVYYAPYHVNSFMFEDNGDTFAYEQDIYTEKKFETAGNDKSFIIQQSTEGLFTPRYEYYRLKIYGLPFTVAKVLVDGKEIKGVKKVKRNKIVVLRAVKSFKRIEIVAGE
jgi:alpha-glucosidase